MQAVTCGIYINIHTENTEDCILATCFLAEYIHVKCPDPKIKLKVYNSKPGKANSFQGLIPLTFHKLCF